MTTTPRSTQAVLQDLLCCSRERVHLLEVGLSSRANLNQTEPIVVLLSQRLQDTGQLEGVEPSWILELACGRIPGLSHQDLSRLAMFLGVSQLELCTLLYGPGHGPGSGVFYAEFAFLGEDLRG